MGRDKPRNSFVFWLLNNLIHNTFFILEESAFRNTDSIADLESLLDEIQVLNDHGYVDVVPTLQDLLALRNVLNVKSGELVSIRDIIDDFLTTDYRSELYAILDKQQSNVDMGYVSVLGKLLDKLSIDHEFNLDDIVAIKRDLEEILKNCKLSDLIPINDRIGNNNLNGLISVINLKDTATAEIIIDDGLDTKINIDL